MSASTLCDSCVGSSRWRRPGFIGGARAGQSTHLMPLFGSVMAVLFLGETFHLYHLVGAVLIGDTADALWYLELIRTRQPTQRIRADMMFGRSLALRSEAA